MSHDACRTTGLFKHAGQNLAIATEQDNKIIAKERIESWFSENTRTDMNEIRKHQNVQNSKGLVRLWTSFNCNFIELCML